MQKIIIIISSYRSRQKFIKFERMKKLPYLFFQQLKVLKVARPVNYNFFITTTENSK